MSGVSYSSAFYMCEFHSSKPPVEEAPIFSPFTEKKTDKIKSFAQSHRELIAAKFAALH